MNKLLFGIAVLLLTGCNKNDKMAVATAEMDLLNNSGEQIGTFYAIYAEGITTATVSLWDQDPRSVHAIHLHDGTCDEIGMHWNMGETKSFCTENSLGTPWAKPFAGDFENVPIGEQGRGNITIQTDLWSIGTGDHTDIRGKLVVVHQFLSDFFMECNPEHEPDHTHSNPKIACGIIQ